MTTYNGPTPYDKQIRLLEDVGALTNSFSPVRHLLTDLYGKRAGYRRAKAEDAPLLEAAKAVLELSPDTYAIGSDYRGSSTEWDLRRVQDKIKAAIAQAEGKEAQQ